VSGNRGERADGRLLLLALTTLLLLVVWAAVGQLDVVSIAGGEVVPAGSVKVVQHLEGGIVEQIVVREGAQVVEGEPLVRLDATRIKSEVDELRSRVDTLAIDIARLTAELSEKTEIALDPALAAAEPEFVAQARQLFAARRERLARTREVQQEVMRQRRQEITETKIRLEGSRKALAMVREQVSISEALLKRDITNRMTHLALQREELQLATAIREDEARLPRLASALDEAESEEARLVAGQRAEAGLALADAQRAHRELSQRLRKYEDGMRRTVLRSPVDGVVKTLSVHAPGTVVKAGETLVEIVPAGDSLVVEGRLPTQEVGYVAVGQQVRISLTGAAGADFMPMDGRVVAISPDALLTPEGEPYYRVRIEPGQDAFVSAGGRFALLPGVQVVCGIVTGTRSVLAYLLGPWLQGGRLALRER
jgi:adhesin transport system membrane fusion protein